MLEPGSEFTVTVEKAVAGGRMLARHAGQVVLIAGTIPGERVRARVTERARGVVYAASVEILEPHAARREPLQSETWLHGPCGGNVYQHISYDHQIALKKAIIVDAFTRLARLDLGAAEDAVTIITSPEAGYRMRARFRLRGGRLGFFREGSHELCDHAATRQLLAETSAVVSQVEEALRAVRGRLEGAIELAENVPASERVLHFSINRKLTLDELRTMTAVDGLTGFTTSVAGVHGAGVVIADPHVHDEIAVEGAGVVRLRRHVRSFFQGNRFLLHRLVDEVVARVLQGPVIDLYAGVGLFAVPLAALRHTPVVAVEVDAFSAHDLRENATAISGVEIVDGTVEDYLRADVGRSAVVGRSFSTAVASAKAVSFGEATVVVDPPRTGLSKDVVAGLLALRPPRVVYVSCDIATLARDVRGFMGGGYRLVELIGFDLFPNTAHVETLCVLECG